MSLTCLVRAVEAGPLLFGMTRVVTDTWTTLDRTEARISTRKAMDTMTIDYWEAACERISTWPMFEGHAGLESMAVLSVRAKLPSVPMGALVDHLDRLGLWDQVPICLLAIGDWFDADNRLASKLSERHGVWGHTPRGADETRPGVEVFGGKMVKEGVGVHWSVVRLRLLRDLSPALSLGARGRAIGLYGNNFDRDWCESVVSAAIGNAHRKECLFVSATPKIRNNGMVIRSLGAFGDPVAVDFVGRLGSIKSLAAKVASDKFEC